MITEPMDWTHLTDRSQLNDIDKLSKLQSVLLFKHSTRCSISDVANSRLREASTNPDLSNLPAYYLDLIQCRSLSNEVAEHYKVFHESPQILLIKNGQCYFDCSHMDIDQNIILSQLQEEQSNLKFITPITVG